MTLKPYRKWLCAPLTFITYLFALSGCTEKPEELNPYFFLEPSLPIVQPLALHKAGTKATVEFWVLPIAGTRSARGFFVGFRMKKVPNANVSAMRDTILATKIPVRMTLQKLDAQPVRNAVLMEKYQSSDPNYPAGPDPFRPLVGNITSQINLGNADSVPMERKGFNDANVAGNEYQEYELAFNRDFEAGRYRLDFEVLSDNTELSKFNIELLISQVQRSK